MPETYTEYAVQITNRFDEVVVFDHVASRFRKDAEVVARAHPLSSPVVVARTVTTTDWTPATEEPS